jgi:hypothetical protein
MKTHPLRAGFGLPTLLFLLLASLAGAGCFKASIEPSPLQAKQQQPQVDRTDCGEIFGSAFRSNNERIWFEQNCSRWPPVPVPQPGPPGASAAAAPEPPECAAVRGRPYQSDVQRTWFLANCQQGGQAPAAAAAAPPPPPSGQPAPAPPPPPPPAQPAPALQASDRTSCDEIRGTAYRSDAERLWYVRNCSGTTGTTTTTSAGPDRTNCNEIRGTEYRSDAERNWYARNCANQPVAAPAPQTNQIQVGQAGFTAQPQIVTVPNQNGNGNGRGGRD